MNKVKAFAVSFLMVMTLALSLLVSPKAEAVDSVTIICTDPINGKTYCRICINGRCYYEVY